MPSSRRARSGANHRYLPLLLGLVGHARDRHDRDGADRARASTGSTASSGTVRRSRSTAGRSSSRSAPAAGSRSRSSSSRFGRHSETAGGPPACDVAVSALAARARRRDPRARRACCSWSPRRRQPAWSWLVFAAVVCVAGWVLVTVALGAALSLSSSFGETYGSLAGLVALQLWTLFSAIAIFFGAAVAAQLEAVRGGCAAASSRADRRSRPCSRASRRPTRRRSDPGAVRGSAGGGRRRRAASRADA